MLFTPCAISSAQWGPPLKAGVGKIAEPSFTGKIFSDIETSLLPARQEANEDDARDFEDAGDPDADIFAGSSMPGPPPPLNLGGNGRLTLTRQDTGESIKVAYRDKNGDYDQAEVNRLNRFMRCSLTGRKTVVPVKLVELLDAVEDKFGKKGLILLSGYRTPELNGRTPGAAGNSLHMLGWAADIRIPGYSSATVKKYGLKRGIGGVGYYPSKGFTHLDVGKPRYWVVKNQPRKRYVRRARRVSGAGTGAQARAKRQ